MRRIKIRFVQFLIRWAHGPIRSYDLAPIREWAGEDIWNAAIGDEP